MLTHSTSVAPVNFLVSPVEVPQLQTFSFSPAEPPFHWIMVSTFFCVIVFVSCTSDSYSEMPLHDLVNALVRSSVSVHGQSCEHILWDAVPILSEKFGTQILSIFWIKGACLETPVNAHRKFLPENFLRYFIGGSLEVQRPTIKTDKKQRGEEPEKTGRRETGGLKRFLTCRCHFADR